MSIEPILDLIRERFSPIEGKLLLQSLQQDPLVWQFVREEQKSLPYFQQASSDISVLSPGKMAVWLIQQTTDVPLDEIIKNEAQLPEDLRLRSSKALESTLSTGLPPANLLMAGLIGLALRERRLTQGDWKDISPEIIIKRNPQAIEKNFQIWRTPAACLFDFCRDFDNFITEFTKQKSVPFGLMAVPIFIHALLANPIESARLLDLLFSFTQNLTIDLQLESLKWLEIFNQKKPAEKLAKNLIQTKKNVDYFSTIFSELEQIESSIEVDPLDKQIRFTLPEDVNRLAAFYAHSNNNEKAAETYQISKDLLNILHSQTLFQTLAAKHTQAPPSQWMHLIQSMPNSKQARIFLIRSLIHSENFEEAQNELEQLPESHEKQLLQAMIESKTNPELSTKVLAWETKKLPSGTSTSPNFNFNAYHANYDFTEDFLVTFSKQAEPHQKIGWIETIIESNYDNPKIMTLCRDILEKTLNIGRSIELTSYLERFEPEKVTHKRDLARLLSTSERWSEAFSVLQNLIKSESSYDIKDLERFAESALRTDRVDMSISICQNILKQDAQNTKALVLLGEGFMEKGDHVKAIQHMEQVVDTIPDEPDTWLTLAKLWEKSGQTDRAFEILSKGNLAVPNNPKLLRAIGIAHLERGAPSDAMTYLKRANDYDPLNKEGIYYLAKSYNNLGQYEQAWQLLEPSVDADEINPDFAKLTGQVLLSMKENAKAEPILFKAAEQRPEDIESVLLTCELVLDRVEKYSDHSLGIDLDKLENLLEKSGQFYPAHRQIQLHLADIDRLRGDSEKALNAYRLLSEESQHEKSVLQNWRLPYGLGQVAMELGDLDIGLAALQDAAEKQPENLLVLHALANACQKADLGGKAHETAKFALKLAPQDIDNILWYADFKTKSNDPQEAVKALREALQITPDRSELTLWLAKIYVLMDSNDEAKETLVDLLSNPQSNSKDLQQAAYLLVHLNEFELASNALEKSNHVAEKFDPTYLMDLAVIYSLLDERKRALEILNVDESLQFQYPQLVLLKSDVLCSLGQYSHAFNSLNKLKDNFENAFDQLAGSEVINSPSPLLYKFDLSKKGYLYRIGQLNRVQGNIQEAQAFLLQAFALEPENARFEKSLCDSYFVSLDFDHAIEISSDLFERENIKKIDPERLDLICSHAEMAMIQGDLEKVSLSKQMLQESSIVNSRNYAILSQLAAYQSEFEDANQYLSKAEQAYQTNFSAHPSFVLDDLFREIMTLNSIAEAAVKLGQFRTSLGYHQHSFEKLDNQPLVNWRLALDMTAAAETQRIADEIAMVSHAPGKTILLEENHEKVQTLIEGLSKYLSQEQWMCIKARAVSAFSGRWPQSLSADACLENPDEAAAVILGTSDDGFVHKIVDAFPEDTKVLQAYGVYALRNNKKDGLIYTENALRVDTSDPILHALHAKLSRNDIAGALNSIETALSFWPDEPGWHAMASDFLTRMGDLEKASHHISQAIRYEPDDAKLWEKSAEIKLQSNDLAHAKFDLEKSAQMQSNNPQVWIKMADINRRMGQVSEAITNMQTASNLAPNDLQIASKEIRLLIDQKQYKEAEEKATEILNIKNDDETALVLLAKSQAEQGKFDQAIETISAGMKQHPGKVDLALEKIKIRKTRDGVEALLPDLINLAHSNPENPEILTLLTDWLIQANRLDEAEETAQTILRIVPEQAEVHLMLGRLQRKKGQLDQSIAHLSDAININPSMVEAYIELGKTYQERRNLEEAIKIFQKGTLADGSDPRPYYHAGMALKECKDYTNAEVMLRQAKKYAPNDTNIIRQLGVITALNLINNLREAK